MAVLILINLISVVICFLVSKRRKANTIFWSLTAVLVGPLAIPFVVFSKPVARNK
ncbi:hypothetical protein AB6E04_21675 [Vibrio amylolyticus]|uniref:hypothetical protein n=1 Tax=Vibrio amylolyticus TaxID=2847292 RepID=UPI00354E8DFE